MTNESEHTESEHFFGGLNKTYGICGFAASIYMACKSDPRRRPSRAQGDLRLRLLVEIAHFLQTLENNDRRLFSDIEKFTRTFGLKHFDLKQYIQRCYLAVSGEEDQSLTYDVAMPPKAVAAYLKQAWNIDAKALRVTGGEGGAANCILGLCVSRTDLSSSCLHRLFQKIGIYPNSKGLYGDLQHWVYRHNSKIYSYGRAYENLGDFNRTEGIQFKVGWKVGWTEG